MDKSTINIDLLPYTIREIAVTLGLNTALTLVDNYGGTRVWVPAEINPAHHLAKRLGFEKAKEFCQIYALEYLTIDKAEKALRHLRDADIVQRLEQGETVVSVALEYGLTERQVYNIKRGRQADSLADSQVTMW